MKIKIDRGGRFRSKLIQVSACLMSAMAVAGSSAMCPYDDGQCTSWRYQMEDSDFSYGNGRGGVQWSPDGSHLVFSHGRPEARDIYAVLPDGSSLWRISPRRGNHETYLSADISPDGSRVVFETSKVSNSVYASSEIKTSRLDGSAQRRVTERVDLNFAPAWSPDGTRIAFARRVSRNSPNAAGIYVIASDGSQERLIAPSDTLELWGHEGIWGGGTLFDVGPLWAPEGNTLAYAIYGIGRSSDSESPDIPYQSSLYRVEADGSGPKRLFADPEPYYRTRIQFLTWSPDGRRIASPTQLAH